MAICWLRVCPPGAPSRAAMVIGAAARAAYSAMRHAPAHAFADAALAAVETTGGAGVREDESVRFMSISR